MRDRNVDVAASFNSSSPSAGKTNMHLDPSIQKAIAAGTAHTLADSTRLDSLYDTPVAGDDLKEHCSSAQGYLSDANSLAIAGLVFLGVGFVTIAMAALRSMMKQTDGFWSSIDYYHKNYQTKEDKPLRLMQFVHRSSNIIGYILIIASGILFFYSLDSSLETYMTSIIFGKWASEAARLNRGSMSEYLPTKTYKFYGSNSYSPTAWGISDDQAPMYQSDTTSILMYVAIATFCLDILITGIHMLIRFSVDGAVASIGETQSMMARLTQSIL